MTLDLPEKVKWDGSSQLYKVIRTKLDEIGIEVKNFNLQASSSKVNDLLRILNHCNL
jgi:hypothetical protein